MFDVYVIEISSGGNGGRGGDVILECTHAVWDFSGLQPHVVSLLCLSFFSIFGEDGSRRY